MKVAYYTKIDELPIILLSLFKSRPSGECSDDDDDVFDGDQHIGRIMCTPFSRAASHREKRKVGLCCSAIGRHAAMGQLLVMLIVPPVVGVVTYIAIRRLWERDEFRASEAVRHDPSAATPAQKTRTDA